MAAKSKVKRRTHQVLELHAKGWSIENIATELGIAAPTALQYLRHALIREALRAMVVEPNYDGTAVCSHSNSKGR